MKSGQRIQLPTNNFTPPEDKWKSGCGWYDASQGTFNFCWAATAGNAIHWWLDRNAAYVDRYFELNNTEKPDFSYPGQGKSNVFSLFTTHWKENKGNFANIGFNRFVNENNNDAIQSSARGQTGYFKDVFGNVLLSETSSSMNRRSFNTFIAKALENGKITVKYDENRKPYMETKNFMYGEVQYGRIDIVDIQSYSQGTEYWEAYFASRSGN